MGNWAAWKGVLRTNDDPRHIGFWCRGCRTTHVYDERWKFDGDYDRPTFTPSLRTLSGHYVQGTPRRPDGKCGWCEDAKDRGVNTICGVCHLNVTKGQIFFHIDSTHAMRGQTVAMTRRE